jgi:hypothetical protein
MLFNGPMSRGIRSEQISQESESGAGEGEVGTVLLGEGERILQKKRCPKRIMSERYQLLEAVYAPPIQFSLTVYLFCHGRWDLVFWMLRMTLGFPRKPRSVSLENKLPVKLSGDSPPRPEGGVLHLCFSSSVTAFEASPIHFP